jgi:hypothetical protein
MKKLLLSALALVSLAACKTLEPAQMPNWSGAMTKTELGSFLPGKTFTMLDVGGDEGDGNTVVMNFDGDMNVDGSSTSGAKRNGSWNLREYKGDGLICMKWTRKGWGDWCFKLVKDADGLKFNEISDSTKFKINKVEQEAAS